MFFCVADGLVWGVGCPVVARSRCGGGDGDQVERLSAARRVAAGGDQAVCMKRDAADLGSAETERR
jgi:hypothetical protein